MGIAAEDLLGQRPCSSFDLDLSKLFAMSQQEKILSTESSEDVWNRLQDDKDSPAFLLLPLLSCGKFGSPERS
jgi:hypothetical protein